MCKIKAITPSGDSELKKVQVPVVGCPKAWRHSRCTLVTCIDCTQLCIENYVVFNLLKNLSFTLLMTEGDFCHQGRDTEIAQKM
jgi:hypothetical protein